MKARNPFRGTHPDLFAGAHAGADMKDAAVGVGPRDARDPAYKIRTEAFKRGETPMVVSLDSLTSEQIRELPRAAFSDKEWDELEDDDREWIEDNDEESQARVDALAAPFISRREGLEESARHNTESTAEYFHQWLSEQTNLHQEMPRRQLDRLRRFGEEHGVDADDVIDNILADASNYTEDVDSDCSGTFWCEELRESVYLDRDDWAGPMDECTEDEIERAIKKINKETDLSVDRKDLDRKYDYDSDSIDLGIYVTMRVAWESIGEMAEEKILELESEEAEAAGRALERAVVPEIEAKNLPRPPQPVVYEWPDGYTAVDMVTDDTEVTTEETIGILRLPVKSENTKKTTVRTRMKEGKLAARRLDDEGLPIFWRGEIAMQLESLELAHCVGWANMGYMDGVRDGELKIYSIRRPNNGKPIFTIEAELKDVGDGSGKVESQVVAIEQIKSYANGVPGFPSGQSRDIVLPHVMEEAIKKLNKGDVEKAIDFIIFLKIDPSTVEDMKPVIKLIWTMPSDGDEWVTRVRQKLNGAIGLKGSLPPKPVPNPDPPCSEHGECGGFCRPYRRRARANPALDKKGATQAFFDLIQDSDPQSMEIAQDLALENGLALADLGEEGERQRMKAFAARAPGSGAPYSYRDTHAPSPSSGWFRLTPSFATEMPPCTGAGWRCAGFFNRAKSERGGPIAMIELRYTWNGEWRAFQQNVAFRTVAEARKVAAAWAWAIAKKLKPLGPDADVKDAVYDALHDADSTPPELYEATATRKKRPTFVEAQDTAIGALQRAGWAISGPLKVRWAQSPNTRLRLWFKPQSVYVSTLAVGPFDTTHNLHDAHSLSAHADFPDLRDMTGSEFVAEIRRRYPRVFL